MLHMVTLDTGQLEEKEIKVKTNVRFDWVAFFLWITSLLISLLPVFLAVLENIGEAEKFDAAFWLRCIKDNDILWVFGTFLLFAFVNSIICKKGKKQGLANGILYSVAIVLFVFIEGAWMYLRGWDYNFVDGLFWTCIGLICFAIAISTPLEISFIKSGG